jgi:hypothetical protein
MESAPAHKPGRLFRSFDFVALASTDPGKSEPGIRLGSMRRIKGLEFKAVAMLIDSSADGAKRLERYVGATRARQWLLVVEVP